PLTRLTRGDPATLDRTKREIISSHFLLPRVSRCGKSPDSPGGMRRAREIERPLRLEECQRLKALAATCLDVDGNDFPFEGSGIQTERRDQESTQQERHQLRMGRKAKSRGKGEDSAEHKEPDASGLPAGAVVDVPNTREP